MTLSSSTQNKAFQLCSRHRSNSKWVTRLGSPVSTQGILLQGESRLLPQTTQQRQTHTLSTKTTSFQPSVPLPTWRGDARSQSSDHRGGDRWRRRSIGKQLVGPICLGERILSGQEPLSS